MRLDRTVLFVEGSQGGVTGGSLTGLLPLFAELPAAGFAPHLVLHETKRVIPQIEALGVAVTVVPRRKVPKEHLLQGKHTYEKAKENRQLASALRWGRMSIVLAREILPSALRLARLIKRHQPEVIHLSNGFRTNADGIIAGRLTGTPVLCHVKAFEKYGPVERWVARLAQVGVCMSEAVRRHCQSLEVAAQKMRVIYDALDPDAFKPARSRDGVRNELGLKNCWPVVAVLGNIQEWKGQQVAVQATRILQSRFPTVTCLIIGGVRRRSEAYAESLQRMVAANGLENRVRFLGERADVPDLLVASDMLLHTSVRAEPFGRVALEAMAVERPVVAARGGGMCEIVEDGKTGLLYGPGDAEQCAAAVARLCENREKVMYMGKLGRERLKSRFGQEIHSRQFCQLYAELAANGRQAEFIRGPRR